MPYCPTNDHRARVGRSTTASARSLPFQLFQKFEDPQVEAAFQRYQAERGLSVVFWIMLGGISVGVIFAIESAFSNALDIPIISHVAWVVPALGLAFWLKTSQQRFVRYYRSAMFALGVLCVIATLLAIGLSSDETFAVIKKGSLLAVFGYLALLRIHLKHTLILSALAIVGFLLALLHHEVSTTVLVQDITEIVVTAMMGSTANWLLESESRTGYLLNYDLTQKVAELEQARNALADEAEEHRATLGQLEHARREAERASEAKSDFLAAVSHELRTPMNGMVGSIQMLGSTDLNSDQIQYHEVLTSSAQNLSVLLDDLFDLTRIEVGMMRIEPIPTNLHQLLDRVAKAAQRSNHKPSVALQFDWEPRQVPRWVQLDPKRVTQILSNLLNNALKFTQTGWVRLNVEERSERLVFSVTDTGVGLPDNAQSIFEKYHQEGADQGGLGLGLSICQMLAEHMGGQISAHHRRPHGAELRVELPLVMASEPSLIQTTASLVQNHRSNASVLLVEDNPINQKVARWNLEQLGCNVSVAADGQAALSWLADHAPDLVIMDCEMPGMSGYEVTKSIRRGEDAMTRLPIVALTAHATAGARERCIEAGMDDYLAKPFRKADLQRILERWLPA